MTVLLQVLYFVRHAIGRRSLFTVAFAVVVVVTVLSSYCSPPNNPLTVAVVDAFIPSQQKASCHHIHNRITINTPTNNNDNHNIVSTFAVRKKMCLAPSLTMTSGGVGYNTSTALPRKISSANVVICGGGPAGLLTSIMLAQKFPNRKIKLYDRLPAPYSPTDSTVWNDFAKFYLIGLGGRGQKALGKFGVWEKVEAVSTAVVGRKDWAPGSEEGVERIFEGRNARKFTTQVLPRDKLVAVLHQYIIENYSREQIELNHEFEVMPVAFDGDDNNNNTNHAVVDIYRYDEAGKKIDVEYQINPPIERVSTDLLIAADGTARTIANYIEDNDRRLRKSINPIKRSFAETPFRVTRYKDDNRRVYKTIPMKLPGDWRPDLNYSARSKGGGMNIDALPANREGNYCGVLLLKEDDPMAQPNVKPETLRTFLNEKLPQFSPILDDEVVAQVAKKHSSSLPAFRFVGPRLNHGDHTLILGDCAHTVKPYFGLGANSALEDVSILSDCIDDSSNNMIEAIHEFSRRRAKDSETLVKISRELDRPGFLGTITFIIPIILDSIFNKINPTLFAPNIISMLQRDDMTFNQVARRKRLDRTIQVAILCSLATGATWAAKFAAVSIAKAIERRTSTVSAVLAGITTCVLFSSKALTQILNSEMAPADVLAKMKSPITEDGETLEQDVVKAVN